METPTEDTEDTQDAEQGQKDDAPPKPVGDVDAYESEWYEVLKRRAEELEAEGDTAEDGDEDEG
jgi:hypothetical protein